MIKYIKAFSFTFVHKLLQAVFESKKTRQLTLEEQVKHSIKQVEYDTTIRIAKNKIMKFIR